jgi:hypothetical protein
VTKSNNLSEGVKNGPQEMFLKKPEGKNLMRLSL